MRGRPRIAVLVACGVAIGLITASVVQARSGGPVAGASSSCNVGASGPVQVGKRVKARATARCHNNSTGIVATISIGVCLQENLGHHWRTLKCARGVRHHAGHFSVTATRKCPDGFSTRFRTRAVTKLRQTDGFRTGGTVISGVSTLPRTC